MGKEIKVPEKLIARMGLEEFITIQTTVPTNALTASALKEKRVIGFDGKPTTLEKLEQQLKEYRGITAVEIGTVNKGIWPWKKPVPVVYVTALTNTLPPLTETTKRHKTQDLFLATEIKSTEIAMLIEGRYELIPPAERKALGEKIPEGVYKTTDMKRVEGGQLNLTPMYLKVMRQQAHESAKDFEKRLEMVRVKWRLSKEEVTTALKLNFPTVLVGDNGKAIEAFLLKKFVLTWKKPVEIKYTVEMEPKKPK